MRKSAGERGMGVWGRGTESAGAETSDRMGGNSAALRTFTAIGRKKSLLAIWASLACALVKDSLLTGGVNAK